MEIRVFKYFLVVAQEENITRAAEILHITQPTLSRQMMQLEDELQTSLFVRGKRSLTLTPNGMLLKRRAEEIVALSEKTEMKSVRKILVARSRWPVVLPRLRKPWGPT